MRRKLRVLALETSDKTGSVAALDDDKLLTEIDLEPTQRSAQSLAPALRSLWQKVGWQAKDVELITVTVGPGSFTGLRVGVTTAKMLAYASGAAVIGVNTLHAIAMQAPPGCLHIEAVLDAQRQELFVQRFQRSSGRVEPSGDATIVSYSQWLAQPASDVAIIGPGLRKLKGKLSSGTVATDEALWTPRAHSVGKLGLQLYQTGQRDDLWSLAPKYFRRSAAEEKLDGATK